MWRMNSGCLRTLAVLSSIVLVTLAANGQGRASIPQTTTFTPPDSAFRFSYPSGFQICTAGKFEPCLQSSMLPVCEVDAIVCVLYPEKRFEDTNINGVSFQVREIHRDSMMTPDICATPYPIVGPTGPWQYPEFYISSEHPLERIGGVRFLHGRTVDGAMSHSLGIDLYRGFHKQRCFELRISTSATSPAVTDPPMRTLSPARGKELDKAMSEILHSFRFSE